MFYSIEIRDTCFVDVYIQIEVIFKEKNVANSVVIKGIMTKTVQIQKHIEQHETNRTTRRNRYLE